MSVWVIPLERMTFQKYSWCSKILQFDIRLIFREQSYSLHHKNKHWNFILLIFHQRGKLWVNYTNMRKKKKNQSKSSKWQPNHNFCKQNSQLSNEPNILWDVVKHTSTFVLEGYFWQSFTHRFTWPAQLTNISHLTVPLLVFTPVIDFLSVIMDSTATFSKILTPNEKKIISLLLCWRHGSEGFHAGIEVKRSSSVLWQSHCVVFFSQTLLTHSVLSTII